jgi:hypothetical protein
MCARSWRVKRRPTGIWWERRTGVDAIISEAEPGQSPARRKADALAAAVGIDFHRPSDPARWPPDRWRPGTAFRHEADGQDPRTDERRRKGSPRLQGQGHGRRAFRLSARRREVTIISHLDYIRRDQAVADLAENLVIDMIDEQVIRGGMNARAIVSNIAGSPDRQRSLFIAAEQCERTPKLHHLTASTADVKRYDRVAGLRQVRPGCVT